MKEVITTAVRILDNVIELSNYPLEQQQKEAESKRRMGIGITGLADAFIFLGVKYGTPESVKIAEKIMKTISHAAYRSSVELAKEKGAFNMFDPKRYCQGKFVKKLPKDIQDNIKQHGIRNSHLTSIAPTGTISLLAGNVSSGLEPVFAFHYTRTIRNTHENDVSKVKISDYAYNLYCQSMNTNAIDDKDLPEYFVSASDIKPIEHLNIQAILQKHVDSSISKTINIPSDYPFKDFEDIYMKAYEKGLKGCTTFRPSEFITGVLVKDDKKEKKPELKLAAKGYQIPKRPEQLEGTTYKLKTSLSPDAFYVTINDLIEDGVRRPYELFINTKNLQHFSWIVAITRLISAVFRHDSTPTFLVDELKSIYDPNGGYFKKGKYMPSLAAEIGYVVEQHLEKIGITAAGSNKSQSTASVSRLENSNKMICPQCNERELINQENCLKCLACTYSKCS